MNEGRTDVDSRYHDSMNDRLPSATASAGLLEPFESEDLNVDWPRARSSDISSLTVQTLIAQPSGAATSVRSELSERVGTIQQDPWEEFGAFEAARHLDSLLAGRISGVVLAVQPGRVGARFQLRSADAIVTLALHSANPGVSNREWLTRAREVGNGRLPSTDRAKARALLKSWLAEDVNTSDRSMEFLKTGLDQDRESGRKLFP
jgi:hypothetical protein